MQRRSTSAVEVFCNVASGFVLAMLTWELIIEPVFGIEKDLASNFGITAIFTAVSLARGYAWRRLFNRIGNT